MKAKLLCLVILVTFLGGCSTGYHKENFFSGGFSEITTGSDSFIVTFKGNEFTSKDRVMKLSLFRASELTIQNGYKYFVILDQSDQSYSYTSHTKIGDSIYSFPLIQPGTGIRIKCFMENPNLVDAIDAEFYWRTNKESAYTE